MSQQSILTRSIIGTVAEFDRQDSEPGAPMKAVVGYMTEADGSAEETVKSQIYALVTGGELVQYQGPSDYADEPVNKLEVAE